MFGKQLSLWLVCVGILLFATNGQSLAEPPSPSRILIRDGKIFTPPHVWLKQHRIFFSIPREWKAMPQPLDRLDYPKDWWIEHWDTEGLNWLFEQQKGVPRGRKFTFDFEIMAMDVGKVEPEIFQDPDQKPFRGKYGINGFTIKGREDDPEYDNVWFVLKLPKRFKTNLVRENGRPFYKEPQPIYLICRAEFPARVRKYVLPGAYSLAESCTLK